MTVALCTAFTRGPQCRRPIIFHLATTPTDVGTYQNATCGCIVVIGHPKVKT